MKRGRMWMWIFAVAMLALAAPFGAVAKAAPQLQPPPPSANVSVFATGLDNPRGLKFGPDGNLYVAEGGQGGADNTVGQCEQVIEPVGPYRGSATGARISMISPDGTGTTAVDDLPSSQTSEALGSLPSGVADVAFIGDTLYAVLAGAGCSHGVAGVPNSVIRANADGTWDVVSDLSAFQAANPVARPEAEDFEPDGTWYSLIASGNALYAIEPNHGELDKISTDGIVSRVVDISATQGHVVPTALAMGPDGDFYVGNLDEFPVTHGDSHIYKIAPDGAISVYASGLTAVLGLAFGPNGEMYALEMSATAAQPEPPFAPGTGRVVQVLPDGRLREVATGLMLPTSMTMGPDGMLYVSNCGFGCPPGAGEIVRIAIPQRADTQSGDIAFELVGQIEMSSADGSTGYGFLSGLGGLSDEIAFSGMPYDASTSQFTFYSEMSPNKMIANGDLQIVDSTGTTTVYYNPDAADFANPDSFRSGTPVLTLDSRQQVIVDSATNAATSVEVDTVNNAAPFMAGDAWYQLAQSGDRYRGMATGQGTAEGAFFMAGYGVEAGVMMH